MQRDPLVPVLLRLDNDPPLFLARDVEGERVSWRDRLLSLGLIQEVAPTQFAVCGECQQGHIRRVRWLTDDRTGGVKAFLPCSECGPVQISPDQLRRWAVVVPTLLENILIAAGGRGNPTEVVSGHLWHLGSVPWEGRQRDAYFARCPFHKSLGSIHGALMT